MNTTQLHQLNLAVNITHNKTPNIFEITTIPKQYLQHKNVIISKVKQKFNILKALTSTKCDKKKEKIIILTFIAIIGPSL